MRIFKNNFYLFLLLFFVSVSVVEAGAGWFEKEIDLDQVVKSDAVPVVYHPSYNISLCGLQRLHPFDTCKYGRVYKYLMKHAGLKKNQFYKPQMVSDEDLLKVHSKEYLDSLKKPSEILKIAELRIPKLDFFLNLTPSFLWHHFLLKPMKYAVGGTILGVDLAKVYGYAINLSGGYHHASFDRGEGFCYFADIQLAAAKIREFSPDAEIMIIDLDAHQGNGYERDFIGDKKIHIFDVYNGSIYPKDVFAKKGIEFDFPIIPRVKDQKYLELLRRELPYAIEKIRPEFIIYNAGTDIFEKDPLGGLQISEDGIVLRDEFVFSEALKRKIPILILLSGGYTKKSAEIIGKSITNLLSLV